MAKACIHCSQPVPDGETSEFCCRGCEAAYTIIHDLGLERWYERRMLQNGVRLPKPEEGEGPIDADAYVRLGDDGMAELNLMVEGLHCAACVWLIESVLARQPGVTAARINMSTRRLVLKWRHGENTPAGLIASVAALGYRLLPYDPVRLASETGQAERALLRAMAVAGFAAGNVMLLSISVWAGAFSDMGPATRDFLHWVSALIALPAVVYAGQPFFRSAAGALRAGRMNMDVPISLAVILAAGMSLFETMRGGEYAYFDASVTLLFFLLIGRYLDRRARARARSAAERLVMLGAVAATVVEDDGRRRSLPANRLRPGMTVVVLPGERVPVDGEVADGASEVDTGLVTGETLPLRVGKGSRVFAGTMNLTGPLHIHVRAAGEDTLLAEIVRLMETAEEGRTRYVALADRIARFYAPAVHILGAATLVAWLLVGAPWQVALLYAVAVLIITCPCALGLAVPAVQAIASGRLFRSGILVKSADALERLTEVDTVVFDKTGTLTLGRMQLIDDGQGAENLRLAASLAAASRHPLARCLAAAQGEVTVRPDVREVPGEGLECEKLRLGRREWCGIGNEAPPPQGPELWLSGHRRQAVRFRFRDRLREDAGDTVRTLRALGLEVALLSGDAPEVVAATAAEAGVDEWAGGLRPDGKVAYLADLATRGRRVLMVGDGLNDAPALASALVSMSPSTAADISQTAADLVFQGERLHPVVEALTVARRANRLVRQNLGLALLYNAVAIPVAMLGWATPLVAAVAMSSSSLAVTLNAMRLRRHP